MQKIRRQLAPRLSEIHKKSRDSFDRFSLPRGRKKERGMLPADCFAVIGYIENHCAGRLHLLQFLSSPNDQFVVLADLKLKIRAIVGILEPERAFQSQLNHLLFILNLILQNLKRMYKYLMIIILLLLLASAQAYKKIADYKVYLNEWSAVVPKHLIYNATHLGNQRQLCYNQPCQYFYYQYRNEELILKPQTNFTILIVSGMHGNQYIGPHSLLYAYPHLKEVPRIVYFPLANPSGFLKQQRETFPTSIDPNRDFPIDGNTNCYTTSSTLIIDHLFRSYRISLTIALHNGDSQISFNWGDNLHVRNSHTQEYGILKDIGLALKDFGGENKKIGMGPFSVGTMTEVIYAASGTFDDWAYAATRYPQFTTKCKDAQYISYPPGMTNGLFFLFQLGPFNPPQSTFGSQEGVSISPLNSSLANGFISRTVRMLKHLQYVVMPKVYLKIQKDKINLDVMGCKEAWVQSLKITKISKKDDKYYGKLIFNKSQEFNVKGNFNGLKMQHKQFPLFEENLFDESIYSYEIEFDCDRAWIGQGSTTFAQHRKFNQSFYLNSKGQFDGRPLGLDHQNANPSLINIGDWEIVWYVLIGLGILSLLGVFMKWWIMPWKSSKKANTRRRAHQKLSDIEYIEESDNFSMEGNHTLKTKQDHIQLSAQSQSSSRQ